MGITLPDDVCNYIAENITNNVRQLEGTVKKIKAYHDLTGMPMDVANVSRAIKDMYKIKPEHVKVTADGTTYEDDYIFGAVCNSTSIAGTIELPSGVVDTADGIFEILLVKMPNTILELNSIITSILTQDYSDPFITFAQAKSIDIVNSPGLLWALDGECSGGYDTIHIEPMPRFLNLQGR